MLHLFHPALVHFTVAFLLTGAVAEGWGLLATRPGAARFGGILMVLGSLTLPLTAAAGFLAANTAPATAGAAAELSFHQALGLWTVAVFLGSQFVKAWERGQLSGGARVVYLLLLAAGVALLIATGLEGGALVYGHGVGTPGALPGP